MSVIRVNPEDIRAYAADAQSRFDAMRADLEALAQEVVSVRYFGPNAMEFKQRCGALAEEFSRDLSRDLGEIADVVRTSTSNISASLGGSAVSIAVAGSGVPVPPVDPGDGSVDVDTSALDALKPVINGRFSSIQSALSGHLARLQGTDWVGQAKESAVDAVSHFTTSAQNGAEQSQTALISTIDQQIQAVLAADK